MVRNRAIAILGAAALFGAVAPAQTSIDELLAQAAKWQYDDSRKPLQAIIETAVRAPGAQQREIEQKFIAFLKSGATPAGKEFVAKQLSLIGTEASVPVLAGMLTDAKTSDMARYALERIPGAAADRALREALGKTSGNVRIGVINTIGERGDAGAVTALRPLALGTQPAEASAALFALARIGDRASLQVLDEAYGKAAGAARASAAEAYLQAANRMAQHGNAANAVPIYKKLYAANEPATVRAAALKGMGAAGGPQAVPVLMEALHGPDLRLQAIAIQSLMPGSAAQLMAEMPKLSEAAQVRILGMLSERGDSAALPAFTAALRSPSKPVRMAALQGIGPIGNASAVPLLAAIAAGDDMAEQTAARASLGRLPGTDVDRAIGEEIGSAAAKTKRELIRAAGDRGATASAPALLKTARDSDADVRRESLRALSSVGTANEIPALIALVMSPVQADDRTDAARSLGSVLRRSDPSRIKDVLAAYTPATDLDVRSALMRVMGQSGNPEALTVLRAGLKDQDASLKRAAILALSEWPDATAVPDLLETARSSSNPAHQTLALRGAVQLIGLPNPARPHRESAKLLADAMGLAKQADEKRAILALLPRYPVRESLDLANSLVNDPDVSAEAKAAAARLQRTVRR